MLVHPANGSQWLKCVSDCCVISWCVKLLGSLRTREEPEPMEHGARSEQQVENDVQRSVELNGRYAQASAFGERMIVNVCFERCWPSKRVLA